VWKFLFQRQPVLPPPRRGQQQGAYDRTLYRTRPLPGRFSNKLSDVLEAYINDTDITDHKRELATLRLILTGYIERFASNKPIGSSKRVVEVMQQVLEADHMKASEKYAAIRDIIFNEQSLVNGEVIDRISRLVENIGKSIDRILRNEEKSGYFLTPEGFKIFLRSIQEIINKLVIEDSVRKAIREELLKVGTRNVASFSEQPVEIEVVDENG
jgi:hypothetical protein